MLLHLMGSSKVAVFKQDGNKFLSLRENSGVDRYSLSHICVYLCSCVHACVMWEHV